MFFYVDFSRKRVTLTTVNLIRGHTVWLFEPKRGSKNAAVLVAQQPLQI